MGAKRSIFLLAAAVSLSAAVALLPAGASAVTKSCGSATIPKPSGGHWVCTFGDNFNGSALDTRDWQPLTTAATGVTYVGECYVDDPSHVSVGGGFLTLTATRLFLPRRCGRITSRYQSGMIISKGLFAQTYGRFKVRAKMPSGIGFHPAFWMWPEDMAYGDHSGEIDVAEYFGVYPELVGAHIHIRGSDGIDHPQGAYCHVTDPAGRFHTYTVVWLPTRVKFIYDGVTCASISNWSPTRPLLFPQPYNKPFFLLLQLALGYGINAPNSSTPFPARFVVDYVRAWR